MMGCMRIKRLRANLLFVLFAGWLLGLAGCAAVSQTLGDVTGARASTQSVDTAPALPNPWQLRTVQGAPPNYPVIQVLQRDALLAPARYRVVLIPGSGCTGFAPFVARYTAHLLHAQVWVLHKPGVDLWAGAAPASCPKSFVQADALSTWQRHAQTAIEDLLQADATSTQPALGTWLVGISEGAELLPSIASTLATRQPPERLAGLVLIGASGLDPREAGALQAQRLGVAAAWLSLEQAVLGDLPDTTIYQGRSLRYWRDMWGWQVAQPLLQSPLPILQVWGQADALVPQVAYQQFAGQVQNARPARTAPWCQLSLPDADHGLQNSTVDGVQQVWHALEQWERQVGPSSLAHGWRCVKGLQ